MRADEALKKNKVIQLEGNKAVMLYIFLVWVDTKNKVPFGYVMRTDWEPVPCDCKVCEAKRCLIVDDFFYGDFYSKYADALNILKDNARCLDE